MPRLHVGRSLPECEDVTAFARIATQHGNDGMRVLHVVVPLVGQTHGSDPPPIDGEHLPLDRYARVTAGSSVDEAFAQQYALSRPSSQAPPRVQMQCGGSSKNRSACDRRALLMRSSCSRWWNAISSRETGRLLSYNAKLCSHIVEGSHQQNTVPSWPDSRREAAAR